MVRKILIAKMMLEEKVKCISDIIPFMNLLEEEFDLKFTDTNISTRQVALAANCSWDTANNHIKEKLKGYKTDRGSKVDKVKHIIEENIYDPDVRISSINEFYRFIVREYPELIDFKLGAFKYYVNKYYSKEFKESKAKSFTTTFETEPGEQAQFDFKENVKVILDSGERVQFDVAVMQLAFSRIVYRKIIPNKTTEVVIDFMLGAFEYFGGVPKELVVDNAKCLVIKHNVKTGEVQLQKTFEYFASTIGFEVYACKPYRAQTKGKVEATMKGVDEIGLYNGKVNSTGEIQDKLDDITNDFNAAKHSTTKLPPYILFKIEKEQLLPLPKISTCSQFKLNYSITRTVLKTGVVNFESTNYSVPYQYIGKETQLLISKEYIHIYYNKNLIASHKKTTNLNSMIEAHIHPSVRRKAEYNKKLDTNSQKVSDDISAAALSNLAKLGDNNEQL